ncbi:MAG: hypothetical protein ACQEQL_00210 [Pseudomonadota bacterium]
MLTFLTLIMLTPSLACAMAYDMSLPAAQETQEPCHKSAEKKTDEGPVLIVDCLGVDLFQQQADEDVGPDLSFDIIDFDGYVSNADSLNTGHSNSIRGPPVQLSAAYHPPSVILTTQRFRL